jgi:hypothetical protein
MSCFRFEDYDYCCHHDSKGYHVWRHGAHPKSSSFSNGSYFFAPLLSDLLWLLQLEQFENHLKHCEDAKP